MDTMNRKTGAGSIARHLRSLAALCVLAAPIAAFSSGCDAGGASEKGLGEANQALNACVTLNPSADAMVTLRPKGQNWGSHPLLRVGGNDESLLKFNLGSISANATSAARSCPLAVRMRYDARRGRCLRAVPHIS